MPQNLATNNNSEELLGFSVGFPKSSMVFCGFSCWLPEKFNAFVLVSQKVQWFPQSLDDWLSCWVPPKFDGFLIQLVFLFFFLLVAQQVQSFACWFACGFLNI